MTPGAFLHLIEAAELETAFGEWAVESALDLIEQLRASGLELPVSVNISARHLQQEGFAPWLAGRMARRPGIPHRLLDLEITESAALYDMDHVAPQLQQLRELGITISLDDFGTGYSSLSYLRRLPMDTLKLDRSFVHGMMSDRGDYAIVQGVIGLARSFGYSIVAEGVETEAQGLTPHAPGLHPGPGVLHLPAHGSRGFSRMGGAVARPGNLASARGGVTLPRTRRTLLRRARPARRCLLRFAPTPSRPADPAPAAAPRDLPWW